MKWLKAGIVEDGRSDARRDSGTPQGSVISPLLANIYLHYVFDLWVHRWRRHEGVGRLIIVRYADDPVVGFQRERDARRFLDRSLTESASFNALHPDKTRLMSSVGSRRPIASYAELPYQTLGAGSH